MKFIVISNILITFFDYLHLFKKKVNNAYLIRLIVNILLTKKEVIRIQKKPQIIRNDAFSIKVSMKDVDVT